MNNDLRDRAILPILIPIAALVFTEIIVVGLSRVLLATGHMTAVAIALGQALVILVGATAMASARRVSTGTLVGALGLFTVILIVAGVVAYQHGPAYSKEGGAGAGATSAVAISAKNVAFSTKTLKLPASGTELDFSNQDNQPHNIAIFPSASNLTTVLFRGTITQPGTTSKYEIGKLKPGTYYFHCDVHPQQMTGTVTVS
jgi:plastocyanin